MKNAEKTRAERDHALVDLLSVVQEWIRLKQKLLEEKENKWRIERGMWGVNSNMNRLREFVASVTKTVGLLLQACLNAFALTQTLICCSLLTLGSSRTSNKWGAGR